MAATMVKASYQAAADATARCRQSCETCHYNCCLPNGSAECGRLCLDCAEICRVTETLLARGSQWAPKMAALCAEVCDACAAQCEQSSSEYCAACAQACRECARLCREIAESA